MKTRNLMLAALALLVLALPSCATLKTSEAEQEEIVSQIQKEDATNPVPLPAGTWFDANGWDYDGLGDPE
jgi:hypothetical protein